VIKSIPHADDADIAESSVSGNDDDHPVATDYAAAEPATGRVIWPAGESNSLSAQRSFIIDMASQNARYRPNW
jgi:hypothetical protein